MRFGYVFTVGGPPAARSLGRCVQPDEPHQLREPDRQPGIGAVPAADGVQHELHAPQGADRRCGSSSRVAIRGSRFAVALEAYREHESASSRALVSRSSSREPRCEPRSANREPPIREPYILNRCAPPSVVFFLLFCATAAVPARPRVRRAVVDVPAAGARGSSFAIDDLTRAVTRQKLVTYAALILGVACVRVGLPVPDAPNHHRRLARHRIRHPERVLRAAAADAAWRTTRRAAPAT